MFICRPVSSLVTVPTELYLGCIVRIEVIDRLRSACISTQVCVLAHRFLYEVKVCNAWVYNPRSATLCFAARVCAVCTFRNN